MSKCIDCGSNFVGTPEQPPPEGVRCKSCEIERLKAELESHAWQVSPAMAQAKLDELNRQIQRLKTELSDAMATPAFGKQMHYKLENESLAAENLRLKAENARLAAQIEVMNVALGNATRKERWVMTTEGGTFPNPNNTDCLRDLLAPTIELLRSVLRDDKDCSNKKIEDELARLRAACGEKL